MCALRFASRRIRTRIIIIEVEKYELFEQINEKERKKIVCLWKLLPKRQGNQEHTLYYAGFMKQNNLFLLVFGCKSVTRYAHYY